MKYINVLLDKYKSMSNPVKASLWFTICNVLNKGIALLATPIFTHIMTTEEYGQFAVYQSWSSFIYIFTSFNLFIGCYEKGLVTFEKDENRFTSSLLGLTFFLTSIGFVIYNIFQNQWTEFSNIQPVLMYAMFAELFLMPAYDFWITSKKFKYQYKTPVIASLLLSAGTVILGALLVMNTQHRLFARVFSKTFVQVSLAIIFAFIIIHKGKCLFNKKYWIYALKFNIPLIPHFLSTMILSQADRIMIGNLIGNSEAAMYSVAYSLSTVIQLVMNGVNSSFTPYCFHSLHDNKLSNIKESSISILLLMAVLSCLAMTFIPEIIYIFAGKSYYAAIGVVPPLVASVFFIFEYSLFSNIEYYFKKTVFISFASIISSLLNILLNFIFIDKFGYYAAGYTTLICYIFFTVVHGLFCVKILKYENINGTDVFDFKKIFIVSFVVLAVMVLMVLISDKLVLRYGLFVIICIIVFIKRDYIIEKLRFKK